MALTKDDLTAIKTVVEGSEGRLRSEMKEEFKSVHSEIKDLRTEVKNDLKDNRQAIDRGFEETKHIMEQIYARKEEVQELRDDLDELKEQFRLRFAN